jgi:hypothetical protein
MPLLIELQISNDCACGSTPEISLSFSAADTESDRQGGMSIS